MNGIICINKPKGKTSFDVVRYIQRELKVKAGHSGTLDPNATGVLVVAINKATKALQFLGLEDKVYTATLKLGIKTDTGDVWGETIDEAIVPSLDKETVMHILNTFVGKQSQRVPIVSAKKIDGKKLYEYHRQNIEVETQYTDIEIFDIQFIDFKDDEITFTAHVSNGTYIRTLCEDIAQALNTVGTMATLNRDQVGKFTMADCIDLDAVDETVTFIPTKEAISLPVVKDASLAMVLEHGKKIQLDQQIHDTVLIDAGEFYAVYKREQDNLFRSVRGLW